MSQQPEQQIDLHSLPSDKLKGIIEGHRLKPGWKKLNETLGQLGTKGINKRNNKAHALLRNDGAHYNPYLKQNPFHLSEPFDCIPHIIDADDWNEIEAGLLERAELFHFILKDIYGDKKLLTQQIVPPELLFSQPHFLRSCYQLRDIQEVGLFFHHTTLILDQSGDYYVVGDKTQQPRDLGLALENRTVLTRTFPSLFRESQVHRLAGFFQRLRQQLLHLTQAHEQHRIVVLAPGSQTGVEFELAHLANYLGLPLVQSGDLIVRNNMLWLKTIEGLKQVDVLYRFIDDIFADPVELRADSNMGIAGLLEVARLGKVKIINPIGVNFLENPLLHKYLNDLCKFYIGRPLRLKSPPTYWCFDPLDKQYTFDNLADLQLLQLNQGSYTHSINTCNLSFSEKDRLIAEINAKPEAFIARAWLNPAETPCFINNKLQTSQYRINCFSVNHKQSFITMPGGFTQIVLPQQSIQTESTHFMGKDTWIIASEITEGQVQQPPLESIEETNWQLLSLPSRVVENLFWLGRYAERAEASLRIMRTLLVLMGGEEALNPALRKQLLICLFTVTDGVDISSFLDHPESDYRSQLLQALNDENRIGSIRSTLNSLLSTTDSVRELLSLDTIHATNRIQDELNQLQNQVDQSGMMIEDLSIESLLLPLIGLNGIIHESMHNIGWRFIELGKRIERAQQTSTLIKVLWARVTPLSEQSSLIRALLMTLELLITYRRRYRTTNDLSSGLDLLVLDETNPRSIIYQLTSLMSHLKSLPQSTQKTREIPTELRLIMDAHTRIKTITIAEMVEIQEGERHNLISILSDLQKQMNVLCNVISDKFFDHSLYPQQLTKDNWED